MKCAGFDENEDVSELIYHCKACKKDFENKKPKIFEKTKKLNSSKKPQKITKKDPAHTPFNASRTTSNSSDLEFTPFLTSCKKEILQSNKKENFNDLSVRLSFNEDNDLSEISPIKHRAKPSPGSPHKLKSFIQNHLNSPKKRKVDHPKQNFSKKQKDSKK